MLKGLIHRKLITACIKEEALPDCNNDNVTRKLLFVITSDNGGCFKAIKNGELFWQFESLDALNYSMQFKTLFCRAFSSHLDVHTVFLSYNNPYQN